MNTLKKALDLIKKYDWLVDTHLNDFECNNLWQKYPVEWQEYFDRISIDDIHLLKFAPHSLQQWLNELNTYTIDDHSSDANIEFYKHGRNNKKKYEVNVMSILVVEKVKDKNINVIVDVGSGKCYLTNELRKQLNSQIRIIGIDRLEQTNEHIEYICDVIDMNFNLIDVCNFKESDRVLLIGLHCCGNLTDIILNMYKKYECIVDVMVVGCCYNLCDDSHRLSYNSRMLACQSIEFKSASELQLIYKKISYRMYLKRLLLESGCNDVRVKRVKIKMNTSFSEFITTLGLDIKHNISDEIDKRLVSFYVLRCAIGRLIEWIIVTLRIEDSNVECIQIFNRSVSTRNVLIQSKLK